MKRVLLIAVVSFLYIPLVFALPGTKKYKATWNANTEPDLAGYSLYWRVPGGEFTDANKIITVQTEQLLTGVVPVGSEIALTASDTAGNESLFSDVLFFDLDSIAPAVPGGLSIEVIQ